MASEVLLDWTSELRQSVTVAMADRDKIEGMDADRAELITHLFAETTAALEMALDSAVEGQSTQQSATDFRHHARSVATAVKRASALSAAIEAVIGGYSQESAESPD
jgi:phage-related baseplate assembly protein